MVLSHDLIPGDEPLAPFYRHQPTSDPVPVG